MKIPFALCRLSCVMTLPILVCMLGALGPAPAIAQTQPPVTSDINGSWTGVLGTGAQQLHLVITVNRSGDGKYSGQLNSVDQGAVLPMDSVGLQGAQIRFEIKRIGGVYEGTLNEDRTEIKGTWIQANVPGQPLTFLREGTKPSAQAGSSTAPSAASPAGPTTKPFIIPVDVIVPMPPHAFLSEGKTNLVYELHVVNMSQYECTLTRVEVMTADAAAKVLDSADGAKLEGMVARPGVTVTEKTKLTPGGEGVVYLWVPLDGPSAPPASIRHRITVKIGTYPDALSVETLPISVSTSVPTISSPLRGDHWLAGNGPSNSSGHRRALIPIDARAVISQRFAIDWVRLGNDGTTFHDDKLDNKNYYAYGVDALAVADGIVTEVKDGIPQNIPGENSRAVPIDLETVGGNHVIIDIGNGFFAFYAHLQPGSLRVKLGDKVRSGQVVGLVGNSGNSTEPHLHFHISNASSPLGSEGLPYLLPSFEVEGSGWTWKPSEAKAAPVKHTMEIPLENEIVRFAEAP